MITYFFKILLTLVIVAGSFGFLVPMLVSSEANLMVLGGFVVLFLTPALVYLLWSDDIAAIIKNAQAINDAEISVKAKGTKKKSSAKV